MLAVAIILIILFLLFITYNGLVTARVRVSEAFSQVDVQLKRRTDLIPNIVETVKFCVVIHNNTIIKLSCVSDFVFCIR